MYKFSLLFFTFIVISSCGQVKNDTFRNTFFSDVKVTLPTQDDVTNQKPIMVPEPIDEAKVTYYKANAPSKENLLLSEITPDNIKLSGNPVKLNLENISLPAFINEIFGNILTLSFYIDEELKNKADLVTLRITDAQKPTEIYKIALSILENYGVAALIKDNVIHFIPMERFSDLEPPIIVTGNALPDVPASHRPIFQIVTLKVLEARQLLYLLSKILKNKKELEMSQGVEVNHIILRGPAALVKQVTQIVQLLDRPFLKGKYSLSIEPIFLGVEQLAQALLDILKAQGFSVSIGVNVNPPASTVLLPIAASNSLFVFTTDTQNLEKITDWVKTLDKPKKINEKSFFFYAVKNTQADTLLTTIKQLLEPKIEGAPQNISPNTTPSLVADTINNALIYRGYPEDWRELFSLLEKLDQPPRQILIEVTVAEVRLSDQEQYGVEWLLSGLQLDQHPATLNTMGGLSIGNLGLTYSLFNNIGQTKALLNAFASNSQLKILSSPRLMVKNGYTASINIGDEIPIVTSQSSSSELGQGNSQPAILQQIQYRSTGIILEVTPTIHTNNRVDLVISQEVSSADTNTISNISSPVISNRSIKTSLNLSDGGSVLLGGLIRNSQNKGISKIPILGDIPLIGTLFRTDQDNFERTELMIMISPYIINNAQEAYEITRDFKDKINLE